MKEKEQEYPIEYYNNPDTYYAAAFGLAAFFILFDSFQYHSPRIHLIQATPGCRSPCSLLIYLNKNNVTGRNRICRNYVLQKRNAKI